MWCQENALSSDLSRVCPSVTKPRVRAQFLSLPRKKMCKARQKKFLHQKILFAYYGFLRFPWVAVLPYTQILPTMLYAELTAYGKLQWENNRIPFIRKNKRVNIQLDYVFLHLVDLGCIISKQIIAILSTPNWSGHF